MRHRAIGQWSRPLEPLKSISHYPNQCQATGFRHICSPSHQAALLKEENGLQPDSRPGLGHADLVYPGGPADRPAQIALGQGADRRTAGAPFAHWQLDKQTYRRLHNVTLNTPDGTTQIDHVFLSPYGIFVLETKNMSGWIFGSEKQAQWTQKFCKRSFKFQNPLRQNYKHLKALEATLGVSPEHLYSVITFVGGSTFKTEVPANVTQGISFIRYIKSFQQPVFSEAEVDAMLQALQTGRRAQPSPPTASMCRTSSAAAIRQRSGNARNAVAL